MHILKKKLHSFENRNSSSQRLRVREGGSNNQRLHNFCGHLNKFWEAIDNMGTIASIILST